jgi:hypothetical protein
MRTGLIDVPAATVRTADGRMTVPAEYSVFADSLTPAADSALKVTAMLLARMQASTRAAGAEFVVVMVPSRDRLYPPGAPQSVGYFASRPLIGDINRPSERVAEICASAKVRCIDPTSSFVAAAQALPRGKLLIFPQDGHWNEIGHAVAAKTISDLVREEMGKMPPPASPR